MIVVCTVTNRPHYFAEVLDSWRRVRGLDEALFLFCVEPTRELRQNMQLIEGFGKFARYEFVINDRILGVARNPWTGIGKAFHTYGRSYVIATEDDLVVADDILEFHDWAGQHYATDDEIAAVCSFNRNVDGTPDAVIAHSEFSPWTWGTWVDRWDAYIGAEWDVDAKFYTDFPGNHVGWDWHLNERILPRLNKLVVSPALSRSNSIGLYGEHSLPEIHYPSASYRPHYEPQEYVEALRLHSV